MTPTFPKAALLLLPFAVLSGCGRNQAAVQRGDSAVTHLGRHLTSSGLTDPNGQPICACDPTDPTQDCDSNDGDGDGDDGCILCQDGSGCIPANPCHQGALACEGGPSCSDTGQAVADGTGCGSGLACQAGSCVPICQPTSCPAGACGAMPDGCGGMLACGGCAAGLACQAGSCVPICQPTSCPAGACGAMPDGCGGTLSCGGCAAGLACQANACVSAIRVGTYGFEALEIDYPRPAPPWYSNAPYWHDQQAWLSLSSPATDGTFAATLSGFQGAVSLSMSLQNGALLGTAVDSSGAAYQVTFDPAAPTSSSQIHVLIQYPASAPLVKAYFDASNANPAP